jgi:hypothetical protein
MKRTIVQRREDRELLQRLRTFHTPDQSAAGYGVTSRPGHYVLHRECAYGAPMTSRAFALMLVLVLAVLAPGAATATPLIGAPVGSPLHLLRPDLTPRRGGPVLPRDTFATVLSPDRSGLPLSPGGGSSCSTDARAAALPLCPPTGRSLRSGQRSTDS